MTKERRLGRGLEALLGRTGPMPGEATPHVYREPALEEQSEAGGERLVHLGVYRVENNPFQPRREFDEAEIEALAQSLKEHGLLQPIVVRQVDDRYQLISGERRLRAAIRAGWSEIAAQVRAADDRQMTELAIVENLQRKDLGPLEKAASFQQYLLRYACTQEELAGRLSIDRSTVANLIRLLELPDAVQDALRQGKITGGHARALLPLGDEREQVAFCQRIASEGLSVRATEQLVQEAIHQADQEPLAPTAGKTPPPGRAKRQDHLGALEQEFRRALGTRVDVKLGSRQQGKIVIHFSSHTEFDRLRDEIVGHGEARKRSQAG